MFKRMKDMKDMIESALGMVAQAQQPGAQAQQISAAQQAAYQAQAMRAAGPQPVGAEAGADWEPIAGVSIAASRGIQPAAWPTAHQGWDERMKRDRAVAQFNHLYRAA